MPQLADTVTKYLGDLIAVNRHCAEAIERQTTFEVVAHDAGIVEVLRRVHAVLAAHRGGLENRLTELEGRATLREALTSVTGFLAGLYDRLRSDTLSRMLRDDFTALHFTYACQSMMITTAHACGDPLTAQLVARQQEDLPELMLKISDLLPVAVLGDLRRNNVSIVSTDAAAVAIEAMRKAWGQTSHQRASAQ